MKKLKLMVAICTVGLIIASCNKTTPECKIECKNGGTVTENCNCDCPPGYTGANCQTAPPPACQTNRLTYVYFQNRSKTNKTYTIYWDGVNKRISLSPGETSDKFTEAAGTHTLEFKIYNTSTTACTKTTVNLAQCAVNTYFCDN